MRGLFFDAKFMMMAPNSKILPSAPAADPRKFGRTTLILVSDWLVIAAAAALPWSTTATGILIAAWLITFLLTTSIGEFWRIARLPAAMLPLILCVLALAGLLWSVAPFKEMLSGLRGFVKLMVIPLLMIQFRRSDKGLTVSLAFLVSCTALLVLSWTLELFPNIPWSRPGMRSVPVKDYISQSAEFLLCIFALAHLSLDAWENHLPQRALGFVGLALMFFANVVFLETSRTSVLVFFSFVVIFVLQRLHWRGMFGSIIAACVLAAVAATLSPYLRERISHAVTEVREYQQSGKATSAGFRLEFWSQSLRIMNKAPIIGSGTGSIEEMFRQGAQGQSGLSAVVTRNPHNQTLAIGIQLGLLGVIVLYTMWIAQALHFCRASLAAWLGLAVVVQNFVSSLVNSHIFDFGLGWMFVFGVGVLGGTVLRTTPNTEMAPSARS